MRDLHRGEQGKEKADRLELLMVLSGKRLRSETG